MGCGRRMNRNNTIHNKTQEIDDHNTPYNPSNILLEENNLREFLLDIKYSPKNINLFRNAFVHKSYCTMKNSDFEKGNLHCPVDCLPLQEVPYERLEFLGDSILGMVIAKYMYNRFPDQHEGFLSKMRTKVVNGKMLGHLASLIGFPRFAIISKQVEDTGGRDNYKIMEDIFEAFIGALYKDSDDMYLVEKWIISVVESYIDMTDLILKNTNYKDMLVTYLMNNYQDTPKYFEINVATINNNKVFTYVVKNRDAHILGTGKGNNRKEAENNASYEALKYLGLSVV